MSDDSKIIRLPNAVTSTERVNNTAHVTTEHKSKHDEKSIRVRKTLGTLGERIKPFNNKFLGAAVIFYYQEEGTHPDKPVFATLCQTLLEEVPEGFADFGHKRLQESMMKVYGKEPKPIRQDL